MPNCCVWIGCHILRTKTALGRQWRNQANGEKKQTRFHNMKTAEAEVKINIQPWNPTSSIEGISSFEQMIDPYWRAKCHMLPPGGNTKAYREKSFQWSQAISDHIKSRQNLVEFFPTFIDKSCVSFSYLKKNKKKQKNFAITGTSQGQNWAVCQKSTI